MQLPLVRGATSEAYELAPKTVVAVGRNYRAHAAEMSSELPSEPLLFLKNPGALVPPNGAIWRPPGFERVDFEGELGVVLGKRAAAVPVDEALDYVLGYTCVNDVTIRDLQKRDKQWARAKGFSSSCPVGPRIVAGLDPRALTIETKLNGELKQSGNTEQMVFSVAQIIAFVTEYITLEPGDLIATGTPAGVANLRPGDVVEISIEGIGTLSNRVSESRPGE